MALWDLFETTSFTPVEQQVVYLTANYEHDCHYCMAAHSGLAKMIGMTADDIAALQWHCVERSKITSFTAIHRMIQARGWVEELMR